MLNFFSASITVEYPWPDFSFYLDNVDLVDLALMHIQRNRYCDA